MSTKSTIQYETDKGSQQGFHLYNEVFDEDNVYLELQGFQFESSTSVELSGSELPFSLEQWFTPAQGVP